MRKSLISVIGLFLFLLFSSSVSAQTISGSILDSNSQPNPGGAVRLYDPSGNHEGDFWVDGNGSFETHPLQDGTYFAFTKFTYNVIDDRWDGIEGSPCLNELCDVLGGTPIVISGGANVTGIDFILDPITSGGRISGHAEDNLGAPVVNMTIAFFNRNGEYLSEARTDPDGNYQSTPFADETYYARTHNNEPLGLGRVMYSGFSCLPATICDDPAFIAANGTPINMGGSDIGGVNFVLSVPSGNIISGRISDDFTSAPMPDVHIRLFDEFGNFVADIQTDQFGDYYFSGLADGNYKVYAAGVPEGYSGELFDGVSCPDWNCDFSTEGTIINVMAADSANNNIALTFTGRRIFGTITRSDTTDPVSSNYGWMGVNIFEASTGSHVATVGTNSAGQYQVTGMELAADDYLVKTTHDRNFHGLINEAWDNYPCVGECDPLSGDVVALVDNQTTIANFILDPAPSISGTVIADNGGASLANIEVCVTRRDGYWQGCALTDINGNYTVNGLPAEADLIPFVNDTNGQSYLLETYIDQPQHDWGNGTGVDISSASATLIDFSLADGTLMSGTLLSEFDGPVRNGGATFFKTDGSWVGFDHVDENGQWAIALPDGNYFLFLEAWDAFNSYVDIFTNGTTELSCMNQSCDWINLAPVFTIAGSPQTVNATLNQGNLISGTLSINDGASVSPVINEGSVAVYDTNGNWINGTDVDASGNWSLFLGDGDYHFYFETRGSFDFYVSEFYNDIPCPWQQCFGFEWVNNITPLTVNSATGPIDAELALGVKFTGTITDENDPATTLENALAVFNNSDSSEQIFVMQTDVNGQYATPALPVQEYTPFGTGYSIGYGRELYDDHKCLRDGSDGCEGAFLLSNKITPAAGTIGLVDHNLVRRVAFSGNVTGAGNPLDGVEVNIWVVADDYLATTTWTDSNGDWYIDHIAPGEYYITVRGQDHGFVGQLYNGISCPQQYCPASLPSATRFNTLDGQDRTAINFDLSTQNPATISGFILDENGNTGPGGAVRIYDPSGNHVGDFWVDENGYFETWPLNDGSYFAFTKFTYNVIDDRWDGLEGSQCLNELCDVLGGTPIVISGGANVTGIDFILDPITSGGRISGHAEDNLGAPVANMAIAFFNRNGDYLSETRTDLDGNYQSVPFADETYYVRTHNNEPLGLGRQMYSGFNCLPATICDVPAFIAANGTAINMGGSDIGGVNFVLSVPSGNIISGKISDDFTSAPMPDVYMVLFDEFGNGLADIQTDQFGDYYFSGLADGNYKVYAAGVPEGYSGELFDGVFCPDWNCDFSTEGTIINVTAADSANNNIALTFSGTRIFGTITRSDNDDPVTSQLGHMEVNVFSTAGDYLDTAATNISGQYQVNLPGAGSYYLSTDNNSDVHALINECWDNVKCADPWDPLGGGATLVTIAADSTFVANFVLDAASTISGTVTAEVGGAAIAGIEMCVARQADQEWVACMDTDAGGNYIFTGLNPRNDYVVWTQRLNGNAYYQEMHQDQACCDIAAGTPIDTTVSDPVIDFQLVASAAISGNVQDTATGNPINGTRVWLISEQCDFLAYGDTDANGNYTIAGFDTGTYYIAAFAEHLNYIRTIYPNEQRMWVCFPDIQDGQAIVVGDTEQLAGFDFALSKGGSISGFITDQNDAPLPYRKAAARLYDLNGTTLLAPRNEQLDGSYLINSVIPGTYQVVLSSYDAGLIDERYDDVPCPRNSCDPNLGVQFVVGPEEHLTNIDAQLSEGAVISGRVTDSATGTGVGGYCLAFYNSDGTYATFTCADVDGYYQSKTGLPDGDYTMVNLFVPDSAPNGYLPQAWTNSGSFRNCGEPCDPQLGDTITVSGTSPVINIDMVMEKGSTIPGSVTDAGFSPLAGVELQLLSSVDGSVLRSLVTGADGLYAFEGVGSGSYHVRTMNNAGYEDLLYGTPGNLSCNPFCDPLSGADVIVNGVDDHADIGFALETTPIIQGQVIDPLSAAVAGVKVQAFNTLGTQIAEATTDSSGNYSLANLWAGTFYVRTANSANFVDALYNGQTCAAGCDPTTGTGIGMSAGQTRTGVDLQLSSAANISGSVSDINGVLSGITVELYLDTGAFVSSMQSNGAGDFRFEGLSVGNYHLVSRNVFGYIDEGAGGGVCQSGCNPTSTATVAVAANASVIRDFSLDQGGIIEGTVFDSGSTSLSGVTVTAYDSLGAQIGSSVSDPGGNYQINGLVAGSVFIRTFNAGSYRNSLYDSLPCPPGCNALDGTAISVTSGLTSAGNDFHLESGFSISGVVQTSGAVGIANILVEAFDASETRAGFAFSVSGGSFEIAGLNPGDYRLRTSNNTGMVDKVHGGSSCTPEPCALSSGTITTVSTTDISGIVIQSIDGEPISGVATDTSGNPLPVGTAWLYSATGSFLKSAGINSGLFSFNGIADGTYYMLVKNDLGLVDQLYSGIDCPNGSCDITSGTPITVGSGAAATQSASLTVSLPVKTQALAGGGRITFGLDQGKIISGNLRRASDNQALAFASVFVFDADGNSAGDVTTDALGDFETTGGLPNGTYFVATSRAAKAEDSAEEALAAEAGVDESMLDEIYNGFTCNGVCAPSVNSGQGTQIVISGSDISNINLLLDEAPRVSIEKTTNGIDADTPNGGDAPVIQTSFNVSWVYTISNIGGGDLSNISVVDNQGVTISCPATTLANGTSMECTASAKAENLSLDPFDGVMGNCNGKPSSRLYQNIGMVTASASGGIIVSDEDASHYCNPEQDIPDEIFKSGFE